MKQKAIVTRVETGADGRKLAVVETTRASACDGCHKKDCGGSCAVSGMFTSSKKMTAFADNAIGAKSGDIVELETTSSTVLGYAALVFLCPIAAGLLFYFLGTALTDIAIFPYLLSLAGFLLSFVVIYFTVERRAKTRVGSDIRIIAVLSRAAETSGVTPAECENDNNKNK